MNKPKFAPGPWSWSYSITDPYSLIGETGETILRAQNGVVYSEYSSDSATIEISSPANAHLIEAAPDMYEALSAIVEALEDGDPTATEARQIAAHAGRNAIASADGST
jgi:hypothetical protein